MLAIEATNRGVADMAWAMPVGHRSVDEVDATALAARPPEAVVVDVREPEEYHHGHVPDAISLPQSELASRLDELPRDRPIYAICQGGFRSLRAAEFLKQVGFDRVVSVAGGTEAWSREGRPLVYGDTSVRKPNIAESEWTHAGGTPWASAITI
jgi:rhodanese-related sulfurtransferase